MSPPRDHLALRAGPELWTAKGSLRCCGPALSSVLENNTKSILQGVGGPFAHFHPRSWPPRPSWRALASSLMVRDPTLEEDLVCPHERADGTLCPERPALGQPSGLRVSTPGGGSLPRAGGVSQTLDFGSQNQTVLGLQG